jgi:outer membrane protein assembly factor BamB
MCDLKVKGLAVFLLVFVVVASAFAVLPSAAAHDPAWAIPTYAYINASPNPVGVNQTATIVMWLDKVMPNADPNNEVRFHDYKLTITRPDGTTETKTWPINYDSTSSKATTFTPTVIGTYTFKFEFLGQTYNFGGDFDNDTYLPSSATTTLNVQESQIAYIPEYPLPSEYWTRPIEGENTGWAIVASNYLQPLGAAWAFGSVRLQPDGTAPDSAHILWTKPISFGGVVGGSNTGVEEATFYGGLGYEAKFNVPIIISGRLYYALPKSNDGYGGGYVCVDLKTGEQIWKQDYVVNPSFAQLEWFDSPNQHGVIPNGYLWAISGGGWTGLPTTWIAYDPWDGGWLFNITNVPSGTMKYGPNGELLIYQLDVANKWLALWNETQVITNGAAGALEASGYRPIGMAFDSAEREAYSWNVTIPDLPSDSAICYAIVNDVILGSASTRDSWGNQQFGGIGDDSAALYATFWAVSLKPESRGNLLWIRNYTAPLGNITRCLGPVDAVSRVFFLSDKETMQWSGYNLDTGEKLWGPVGKTRAFQFYGTTGDVPQVGFVAYGRLYTGGYGGEVFCYDSKTGDLLWKYNNTNSGLQTPYGLWPTFITAIADGKVYLHTMEHSPNSPLYKGGRVRCINATTGNEIWTMLSWAGVNDYADDAFPIADGIMTYLNYYDMQIYAIGKGPSVTTVTASPKVVAYGNQMLIEGTVIDTAAGTALDEQTARFPNGVPAVSDASMSAWMEYVYMQKPKPTDVTGVLVHLTAIDPNGNFQDLGTAVSDSLGNFAVSWIPPVPGLYTVTASFEGSKSYYSSQAGTSFVVSESAAAVPVVVTPTQAPGQPSTPAASAPISAQSVLPLHSEAPQPSTTAAAPTLTYIAIGAAVIIIVVVAAVLIFRRRK